MSKIRSVIDDLFTGAADEAAAERLAAAKDRVKAKLRLLAQAKQVVRNIELELDDLRRELEESL